MKQKVYNCVIRLRGEVHTTIPVTNVTRDELRLLAFIHGAEALAEVRYLGEREVVYSEEVVNGEIQQTMVQSQDQEYRRLARKYDSLVNTGRGKKMVEACFKTVLDDFDAIVESEDPVATAERLAREAEASAEISAGGAARVEAMRKHDESVVAAGAANVGIGAKLAESVSQRNRN